MSEGPLPVGTRIRFTRTLTEGACEEHPGRLFAEEGDLGEVIGHECAEGHWVKRDAWPVPFGASRDEIELV